MRALVLAGICGLFAFGCDSNKTAAPGTDGSPLGSDGSPTTDGSTDGLPTTDSGLTLDPSRSTVTVDRATVVADGTNQAIITIKLRSADDLPLEGLTVTLAASGGASTLTQPAVTDATGLTTGTIKSTVADTKTITAMVGTVTLVAQPTVAFVAGAQAKLVFSVGPASTTAGVALAPAVKVAVQDTNGNQLADSGLAINMALATPNGAFLEGTVTRGTVAGLSTFDDLKIAKPGTYQLQASATGLTSITSSSFTIAIGPAAKLGFVVQPTTVPGQAAMLRAVQVEVEDAGGNLVDTRADQVTLAIGTNPSAATLSSGGPVAASAGVAIFRSLRISKTGTGFTLVASAGGLTSATSAAFDVGAFTASDGLGHVKYTSGSAPVFDFDRTLTNNAPNATSLAAPSGAALDVAGHRLFVTDFSNSRVVVYNLGTTNAIPSTTDLSGAPRSAVLELGHADLISNGFGLPSTTELAQPTALAFDATNNRLYVADQYDNRVMVFNTSTITNGMAASFVLGQADFTTKAAATTRAGMKAPQGLALDVAGNRLFVADTGNHRVLVFNTTTLSNGMNAANVLGQASFTTGAAATTRSGLSSPRGLVYDAGVSALFVADAGNNRVLAFNSTAISDGVDAVYVLGQGDYVSSIGSTTQNGLATPLSLTFDPTTKHLFVGGNRSVRIFDMTSPTAPPMNAINILGQAVFSDAVSHSDASGTESPAGLAVDPTNSRLFVADQSFHRVLQFDGPFTDGKSASAGLGHLDTGAMSFTRTDANDAQPDLDTLSFPSDLVLAGTDWLFVADTGNNRVLRFTMSSAHDFSGVAHRADMIFGNPGIYSDRTASSAADGLNAPSGVAWDQPTGTVWVADQGNNRVVGYGFGTTLMSGKTAGVILGTSGGGTTQSSLNQPRKVAVDTAGRRLFVSDTSSNRVVVFDLTATPTTGMNAMTVIGQPNFTTSAPGTSQGVMNHPAGIAYDPITKYLYVADSLNNRVLVYDATNSSTFPSTGALAVYVIGQTGFGTSVFGNSASQLNRPDGLAVDSVGNLYVSDSSNSRVLVFTSPPQNGPTAASVIGYEDFATQSTDYHRSLGVPAGLAYDASSSTGHLFMADTGRNRALRFDLP